MIPAYMFHDDNSQGHSLAEHASATEDWPQARGELLGFAMHMERKGQTITAMQLRVAIEYADRYIQDKNR